MYHHEHLNLAVVPVTDFLDKYFEILYAAHAKSSNKKITRQYGKLSGVLGLVACEWIVHQRVSPPLVWYIEKLMQDKKYVPSTFASLSAGERRNYDGIYQRLLKVGEQYVTDMEDSGIQRIEDETSDTE
jgi:hypothetical protein